MLFWIGKSSLPLPIEKVEPLVHKEFLQLVHNDSLQLIGKEKSPVHCITVLQEIKLPYEFKINQKSTQKPQKLGGDDDGAICERCSFLGGFAPLGKP